MPIPSRPARILSLALAALVCSALAASAALAETARPPAKSSKNCAKAIVDDWYPDGRVDFLYPIPCYTKAIKSLPADIKGYGSAEADILRALQFAKKNRPDPGRSGSSPTRTETVEPSSVTTTSEPTRTDTNPEPIETSEPTDTGFGGGNVGGGADGPSGGSGEQTAAAPAGSADSSSIPIPLIVLGGLAVLLLAAGGAGYLSRRMRGGDVPEDDPASTS